MNHIDNLKGVIFDYGGTIDSRGVHWSEVIWDGYCDAHVAVTKEQFRECYVFAERELAKVRHILPHHNFHDLLLIKMRIELGYLAEHKVAYFLQRHHPRLLRFQQGNSIIHGTITPGVFAAFAHEALMYCCALF